MKDFIKKLRCFFTPNRIATIVTAILVLVSVLLLIKMNQMEAELEFLKQKELELIQELGICH